MKEVQIWSHKDGDHLAVVEVPWWKTPYEWTVNRICPCCGVSGWLSNKSEFISFGFYRVWNHLLGITRKYEKELYKVPIDSHCVATQAIYGIHDMCWEDNCPVIDWQGGSDAYNSVEGA